MKTKKNRMFIVAIVMGFMAVAAALLIGLRVAPDKALLNIMEDRVDLQIKDVRYTDAGASGMKWEITADSARYLKRENLALFEKLTVLLIMKDGRTFMMKGDQGRLDTQTRDMEMEGNIGIVSGNGDRFSTDRLRYSSRAGRIETDSPVVVENADVRVSGVGMVLQMNENRLSLLSRVRAVSGPAAARGKR